MAWKCPKCGDKQPVPENKEKRKIVWMFCKPCHTHFPLKNAWLRKYRRDKAERKAHTKIPRSVRKKIKKLKRLIREHMLSKQDKRQIRKQIKKLKAPFRRVKRESKHRRKVQDQELPSES